MSSFSIEQVVIRVIRLPFREPLIVSPGTIRERDQILLEVRGHGISGWGECAVMPFPFYAPETPLTVQHILKDFVVPMFLERRPKTPSELAGILSRILGNNCARSGLEMAYWDWTAKAQGIPLYKLLGGTRNEIPVGVSLGIFEDKRLLAERVKESLARGYHRVKIGITPGCDVAVVRELRESVGDFCLSVDANGSYRREDIPALRELDNFGLEWIEQPFIGGDLCMHAELQRSMRTKICLDESVGSIHEAAAALELGSCKVINIKPGRVGGLCAVREIHDLALHSKVDDQEVGVWCGGMLETGVGRAINMAVATLPNFQYPGDISESARYYFSDIVTPNIALTDRGTLMLPEAPGIGLEVDEKALKRFLLSEQVIRA